MPSSRRPKWENQKRPLGHSRQWRAENCAAHARKITAVAQMTDAGRVFGNHFSNLPMISSAMLSGTGEYLANSMEKVARPLDKERNSAM